MIWARILQKQLHHINFGKVLNKIGLDHFLSKINPISEKCVLNFKVFSFCPDNLNQLCICWRHHRKSRVGSNLGRKIEHLGDQWAKDARGSLPYFPNSVTD